MNRSILILLAFALSSCHDVFDPQVEEIDPYLVVEGYISTQPGPHYIYIRYAHSFNENAVYRGPEDAIVYLQTSVGGNIYYTSQGNGIYYTYLEEGSAARIGETYTLEFITSDGTKYTSTPQTVLECPHLDSVIAQSGTQTVLTETVYGEAREIQQRGISIKLNAQGIQPDNNLYLYKYSAFEEHYAVLWDTLMRVYTMYRHRPLSLKYMNQIHTANGDDFGNRLVLNDKLIFIPIADMKNYNPVFPQSAGYNLQYNRFEGLLLEVDQCSISEDAYTFYSDIETLLKAEGSLFDPMAPRLTGNIRCVSDTNKYVLGVFAAMDIKRHYSYHFMEDDKTFSQPLDSMPELWLDTCSWSKPATWVTPPVYF